MMVLVDTSVWIDHLHHGDATLASALEEGSVLTHPFVIGELACGNLRRRAEILRLLGELPQAPVASTAEVLEFIERRHLMGRGIGFVDAHLLASVTLAGSAMLLTSDRRLAAVATQLQSAQ
jgi:predicted nucleic acid-binding protein